MKTALIVIDMQNDYLWDKRKSRFSYDTPKLVGAVNGLIRRYAAEGADVIYIRHIIQNLPTNRLLFGYSIAGTEGAELYSGLDFKETEKAARKGDSGKQYQLAWLYDRGHGIQQDMKKAISWFVISAYNGYAPAQTELGIMYQHGIEATTVSLEIFGKGTVLEKST